MEPDVTEMKPFVHLHNHTAYSLLDGASKLDEMIQSGRHGKKKKTSKWLKKTENKEKDRVQLD